MPRKEKQAYNFGPAPIGEISLVDTEGRNITDPAENAARVVLASDKTEVRQILEEQTEELRRIRRANELILGQAVEEAD